MPNCKGCGGSYDDNFKFCPYCGRAKPEPEAVKIQVSVSSIDKWETCKITRQTLRDWDDGWSIGGLTAYFRAEAIGSKGVFIPGESPRFLGVYHRKEPGYSWELKKSGDRLAYSFFVNQLIKDGWEPTGTGEKWWESQFRRRFEDKYPLPWTTWEVQRGQRTRTGYYFYIVNNSTSPPKEGPTSREFQAKTGFLTSDHTAEKPERLQILNEFLDKLQSEGYELVPPSESEPLKGCYYGINEPNPNLWFFRILLKREY